MIPIVEQHEHHTNITESEEFTVEINAKTFKILSSTIYSNKKKAIMREYATNAFDAHKDNGNSETPFDVHLPSRLEPYLMVTDYGIGLSLDDIRNIFKKFFYSTKTDDNTTNGCLGLGSKSAYAYTDQFIIVSIKDGIETTYSCFMNRDGKPDGSLFVSKTIEEDGKIVSFRFASDPRNAVQFSADWADENAKHFKNGNGNFHSEMQHKAKERVVLKNIKSTLEVFEALKETTGWDKIEDIQSNWYHGEFCKCVNDSLKSL